MVCSRRGLRYRAADGYDDSSEEGRLADEIRQKLDNGEFIGERGPHGEKGDKGEKGEQGEKGEPGERGANGADAPQIDDNAVSANTPWSSQRIVNTLCQEVTASGNPVACTPVKDSPLGIKVSWEPTQAGSGTPSPTNIRPITGRESVTLNRYGKNMLDMSRVRIAEPAYGLIVASDGDIITINGTATHTGTLSFEILRVGQPELNGTNVKIQAFCSKGVISGIYENKERIGDCRYYAFGRGYQLRCCFPCDGFGRDTD